MGGRRDQVDPLLNRFSFTWKDRTLLERALTHTSYANECKHRRLDSNQRLEFLGDAVLELIISEYLYTRFPHFPEGNLTKIRAAVVCEPSLAQVATELGLGKALLLGKGEERTGGRRRPAAMADAFEALVGAIFLDQGIETARAFVLQHLEAAVTTYVSGGHSGDYKSELQEYVQQYSDNKLCYKIVAEQGPDHNKLFTAQVFYQERPWGIGQGRTKKEAEQAAAQAALTSLHSEEGRRVLGNE